MNLRRRLATQNRQGGRHRAEGVKAGHIGRAASNNAYGPGAENRRIEITGEVRGSDPRSLPNSRQVRVRLDL